MKLWHAPEKKNWKNEKIQDDNSYEKSMIDSYYAFELDVLNKKTLLFACI